VLVGCGDYVFFACCDAFVLVCLLLRVALFGVVWRTRFVCFLCTWFSLVFTTFSVAAKIKISSNHIRKTSFETVNHGNHSQIGHFQVLISSLQGLPHPHEAARLATSDEGLSY
jgi:hypothetical protein